MLGKYNFAYIGLILLVLLPLPGHSSSASATSAKIECSRREGQDPQKDADHIIYDCNNGDKQQRKISFSAECDMTADPVETKGKGWYDVVRAEWKAYGDNAGIEWKQESDAGFVVCKKR